MIKSTRGMSLIETMLVMGILATALAGIGTVMSHYRSSSASIADKLGSLDLQRNLTNLLTNGGVCDFMLTTVPAVTFDPLSIPTPAFAPFTQIPSRGIANAEPALVVDGVTPASPLTPRLLASSIEIRELTCTTAPCTPTTNEFNAILQVSFDPARTAQSISPLRFPVTLKSTGTPGNQTITGCEAGGSGAGSGGTGAAIDRVVVNSPTQSCGALQTNCNPTTPSAIVQANCPAGYQVTGCGYTTSYNPTPNDGSGQPWDFFHSNGPDEMGITNNGTGNGCQVQAGGAPGCGVCFTAEAICLRMQ